MASFTRRRILAAGLATLAATRIARAAAPPRGTQAPGFYRFRLGSYELTAIHDGVWHRPIDAGFIAGADAAAVQRAMASAYMPDPTRLPIPFTALAINTGTKLVLIDTGTGGQMAATAGSFGDNLSAADIDPKSVDTIAISHFHPDHINGLVTKDGALVFPNAEIMVPRPEWAFFMDDGNLAGVSDSAKAVFRNARRVFAGAARNVTQFEPGREVAPGIASIPAYGHTPGHVAFSIASESQSMLVLGDTTNRPELFLRHPEWQPVFDMDGPMAVANRKRLLDRVVADRMLVQGYHFPFPASGHVAKTAGGYELVPVPWQPAL